MGFFTYFIQHCFFCLLSDPTVSEDAGIEPRTVATLALTVRLSKHSARSSIGLLDGNYKLLFEYIKTIETQYLLYVITVCPCLYSTKISCML